MTSVVDHIQGQTYHGRKGAVSNAFRYSIDYVMLNAEEALKTPRPVPAQSSRRVFAV